LLYIMLITLGIIKAVCLASSSFPTVNVKAPDIVGVGLSVAHQLAQQVAAVGTAGGSRWQQLAQQVAAVIATGLPLQRLTTIFSSQ
jgi:hypothetical protein